MGATDKAYANHTVQNRNYQRLIDRARWPSVCCRMTAADRVFGLGGGGLSCARQQSGLPALGRSVLMDADVARRGALSGGRSAYPARQGIEEVVRVAAATECGPVGGLVAAPGQGRGWYQGVGGNEPAGAGHPSLSYRPDHVNLPGMVQIQRERAITYPIQG